MTYNIKAGRKGDAIIEVFQDDRYIVRVTGKIGYKPPETSSQTKFKIGQYRDYMPFVHKMDVDWLTMHPWLRRRTLK